MVFILIYTHTYNIYSNKDDTTLTTSRYTRLSSSSSSDSIMTEETSLLGAMTANDIKFSSFLQQLTIGSFVEVMIGTRWTLGTVIKSKYQENIRLLRYFKVFKYRNKKSS